MGLENCEFKLGEEIFINNVYFVNHREELSYITDYERYSLLKQYVDIVPGTIAKLVHRPNDTVKGNEVTADVVCTYPDNIGKRSVYIKNIPILYIEKRPNNTEAYKKLLDNLRNTPATKPSFIDEQVLDHFTPIRIIYNNPATIVFWTDGTKTVVKKNEKEKYNSYNAFCAALAKKVYGTNSEVNRIVRSGYNQKMAEGQKKLAEFKKKVEKARKAKKGKKHEHDGMGEE